MLEIIDQSIWFCRSVISYQSDLVFAVAGSVPVLVEETDL